jgi:hypothetical protein
VAVPHQHQDSIASGLGDHAHPCAGAERSRIAECPKFVVTGCRAAVVVYECAADGTRLRVVDYLTGEPHTCPTAGGRP